MIKEVHQESKTVVSTCVEVANTFKAIMKVWDSMAQYRRLWSKSCHAPQARQAAQPHGSRAVLGSVALLRVTVEILAPCSCGSAGCRAWALPAGRGDEAGTGSSIPQHCTAWCWHVLCCLICFMCMSALLSRCPDSPGHAFALQLLGLSSTSLAW